MTAIPHFRLLLLAAALLLLLAAPAGARAACGDYLHVGDDHIAAKPAKPAPKPCDGPNCSQRQMPELPPAPVPAVTFSDDFGCVVQTPRAPALGRRAGWLEAPDIRAAIHSPSDIFHPPR